MHCLEQALPHSVDLESLRRELLETEDAVVSVEAEVWKMGLVQ